MKYITKLSSVFTKATPFSEFSRLTVYYQIAELNNFKGEAIMRKIKSPWIF